MFLQLLATALLGLHCFHQCSRLMATALFGLAGQSLHSHGSHLLMLFFNKHCTCAAFVLVLQAGKSGLMLQLPGSQAGKPCMETVAVKPQEDGACCLSILPGPCKLPSFVPEQGAHQEGTDKEQPP
jgi:hypothetical protein